MVVRDFAIVVGVMTTNYGVGVGARKQPTLWVGNLNKEIRQTTDHLGQDRQLVWLLKIQKTNVSSKTFKLAES